MVTILLAAGKSERMQKAKLLLFYKEKPLIYWALKSAIESSKQVIVVTGFYHQAIEKTIKEYFNLKENNILLAYNDKPHLGQFHSTQVGLKSLQKDIPFALALADLPLIEKKHYNQLKPYLKDFDAVRPYYKEKPGHPVLCSAKLRSFILNLPINYTVNSLLENKRVYRYQSDDFAYTFDIDDPLSYQKLLSFQ
jgi:molybdenum cofactor cytidylyltransferase